MSFSTKRACPRKEVGSFNGLILEPYLDKDDRALLIAAMALIKPPM